jgi:hypothetical protein
LRCSACRALRRDADARDRFRRRLPPKPNLFADHVGDAESPDRA